MTDNQVLTLGRAVILAFDYAYEEPGALKYEDTEGLLNLFTKEMGLLIERDPDRAKMLLKRGTMSGDVHEQEAAVVCAPALAQRDFGLARDMIAYLVGSVYDVSDVAAGVAGEIERGATPEQAADLRATIEASRQATERIIPPGLAS